ncbi:hypothetical protein H0Z60_12300 [Ectothiorhodospiraceae bacterium WFHF3C12]|nr:hypothetical protein [Ectothiorhodospiraceae bacterium WFHF3C12]
MARRSGLHEELPDENGISGFGRKLRQCSVEERIENAKRAMQASEKTTREIRERHRVHGARDEEES